MKLTSQILTGAGIIIGKRGKIRVRRADSKLIRNEKHIKIWEDGELWLVFSKNNREKFSNAFVRSGAYLSFNPQQKEALRKILNTHAEME